MSKVDPRMCAQCGAPAEGMASSCKFCGSDLPVVQAPVAPQPPRPEAAYTYEQAPQSSYAPAANPSGKSKVTAGILAILLGGLGIHKFYLGKPGKGILYLIFCWTYIPAILGLIEGIIYLTSSDEVFYQKYVLK